MTGVFISYRRSDTAGWAGRLADHLKSAFGDERVFIDVSDIDPGDDFEHAIDAMLDRVDAVVVMIGPEWTTVEDDRGLRLARQDDHVRREVADALRSDVRVLPVLVDGAVMPGADQLPEDLQPLTRKNAIAVSGTGFRSDLDQIVRMLRRELPWYARPPRKLAIAGALALLVIAALVGLVVALSGDDQTSGDAVAGAKPGGEASVEESTTTSRSTSTSSTTAPVGSAIVVTSTLAGNTTGQRIEWIVPEESVDEASEVQRDDPTEFGALARDRGWVATSFSSDESLTVVSVIQGTPRLADENLSVAVTGFRIEVLDATTPAAGAVVDRGPPLPLTDDFRIDAKVLLPPSVEVPPRVDLEVDGEPVEVLRPFSLSATDSFFLTIEVDTSQCTCTWLGEMDVLLAGQLHTYPIVDEEGEPFITSGWDNVTGVVEPAPPPES